MFHCVHLGLFLISGLAFIILFFSIIIIISLIALPVIFHSKILDVSGFINDFDVSIVIF